MKFDEEEAEDEISQVVRLSTKEIILLDSNGVNWAGDDHQDWDEDLEGVDRVAAPLVM